MPDKRGYLATQATLLRPTSRRSGLIRKRHSMMRPTVPMTGERPRQGLLDTNIVILRKWVDPQELPEEMAISAVALAELSAGPHEVRRNNEQHAYDELAELVIVYRLWLR